MNAEITIPGPCINFKIAVLARLMDEHYKKAYRGLGLTNEQIRMTLNLKRMGPVNQKTLAKRLVLEKSSFSRTLKSMIQKGYVKTRSNPEDARQIIILLSEKGEKKAEKIFPVWKKIHEDTHALFGHATVNELDRMLKILLENKLQIQP